MEHKQKYDASILTGLVVFDSSKNSDGSLSVQGKYGVSPETESFIDSLVLEIQKDINNVGRLVIPPFGMLTNLAIEDSAFRSEIFKLSKPLSERPYTILYLSYGSMMEEIGGTIRLLSEKRKLNVIPVIFMPSIVQTPDILKDAIFGNIGNFYIGNISEEDKSFLQQRI